MRLSKRSKTENGKRISSISRDGCRVVEIKALEKERRTTCSTQVPRGNVAAWHDYSDGSTRSAVETIELGTH